MRERFTIIDGYNLLHVCGFLNRNIGPGTLENARNMLLGILARHLSVEMRSGTTVVFDSAENGELPRRTVIHEVLVEFSRPPETADDLIEQLVRKHSAPRSLLVVSSDHRLQNAARRRGARAINCDDWMDELVATVPYSDRQGESNSPSANASEKPKKVDVEFWKNELGLADREIEELAEGSSGSSRLADLPGEQFTAADDIPSTSTTTGDDTFPPGYADDLFEDDRS